MLSPEYLWGVVDPVVDIWEKLNIEMIKDICERLMSAELYDYHQLPGAARYEAWLANQYGMHYEEMVKVAAELTKKSESEVKNLFEEAGLLTLENDQMIYDNHDISPIDIRNNSTLSQMLTEMYTRTNGELKNYTRTTLQNMPDEFYHAMDKAYTAVASGVESYSKAISDTVEELAKAGTHVTYPTGHKDTIEVAVRRAVLTGLNQGAALISLQNAIDNGFEYVVVDAHLGARVNDENKIANHAGWQGKIFKIEGKTKDYGNLKEETGFPGDPLGLCGYNCRHNFYPYMLGDPNPFEKDIPDEKENRKAYENSQKQRSMERKIRESKRNLMGLQTCIDNCKDEKAKFELQQEYNKKADRLQKQNKAYKEFCEENGLKTEQDRLKAAGWNRKSADQARSGAKQYKGAEKSEGVPAMELKGKAYSVYSEDEIKTMANQTQAIADKYVKKESKWSGNIIVDNGAELYGKLWNCDIVTRSETSPHIILHEQLHAKSISYFDKETYMKNQKIEEATVQLAAQEISRLEGIIIDESEYDYLCNNLRKINNRLKISKTDFDFSISLIDLDVIDRIEWIEKHIDERMLGGKLTVGEYMELEQLLEELI